MQVSGFAFQVSRCLAMILLVASWCMAQTAAPAAQPAPDSLEAMKAALDRANTRLQDWAQLARYRDANHQLGAPKPGEKRVVFLGDSITDGWKLDEYFPGKGYINRGISGQTTPQMLVRLRPDVIDLHPRVVLILAGTNDIAGNTGAMTTEAIERNYASMAELLRLHGAQVIFASVMPVHDSGTRKQTDRRDPAKIRELNAWLRQYTREHKLGYVDYFSAMVGPDGLMKPELANDGLHPNAEGYQLIAPLAARAVEAALRKTK